MSVDLGDGLPHTVPHSNLAKTCKQGQQTVLKGGGGGGALECLDYHTCTVYACVLCMEPSQCLLRALFQS